MTDQQEVEQSRETAIVPATEKVERRIFSIRGQNVMLDSDLAALYGVETKSLNLAVRRNQARFPDDFMFRLTDSEYEVLRFQFETSNTGSGGRRYLPYVFTEQGVAMLSSVMRSERAVQVNIAIMRAFVQMRRLTTTHQELAWKLMQLEQKYDEQFDVVFQAIQRLIEEPPTPERRMGFRAASED